MTRHCVLVMYDLQVMKNNTDQRGKVLKFSTLKTLFKYLCQ